MGAAVQCRICPVGISSVYYSYPFSLAQSQYPSQPRKAKTTASIIVSSKLTLVINIATAISRSRKKTYSSLLA